VAALAANSVTHVTIVVNVHEEILAPLAVLRVVTKHYALELHAQALCEVSSGIRASAGVRSPLRLLHVTHAVTTLTGELSPPRERGRM
jgi:hypothetical protein